MKHFVSKVVRNDRIACNFFRLEFTWYEPAETPVPGQFVTIRNTESTDPLLRRPFAISHFSTSSGSAQILYQRRGKATQALTVKRSGDLINVLGPLGNRFPLPQSGEYPVLVAGGVGVGPILFYSEHLSGRSIDHHLVIGARNRDHHFNFTRSSRAQVILCTDDGSRGAHGTAVAATKDLLPSLPASPTLFACGPTPMLHACHRLSEESTTRCWVSMEQIMGCAVGACMGCVIKVKGPEKYARVCTEGPVFDSTELVWR